MLSSVEEKASLKGVIGYYLIGAILVLTTPNLLAFVYNVTDDLNHEYVITTINSTCTTAGGTVYTCTIHTNCSKNKTETIPALGHNWGGWFVATVAQCEKIGEEKRVCSRGCVETKTIEALEHQWSDYTVTKVATCSEEGKQKRNCTVCRIRRRTKS